MKTFYLLLFFIILFGVSCEKTEPEAPKSSAKEISSPSIPIPNATSSFDSGSNTYTYTVAANTNIKAIAFNFSLPAGATSVPAPGSVQDFTSPVKYTITAEDGSKSVMTAVVSFVKSSEKFFKFFEFNLGSKYNGKIDEANSKILVIISKGTDLTKLSPVYGLSDRTTISPIEVISDFSKPKTYILTAEDGSTRKYEVNVKIDNSIVNYAPEKYLGTFEKNLEGIRAKIEEVLKVPIPKINRIYMWNRDGTTTKNDTDVGELINDKTVNDLYSLNNVNSNGLVGEGEEFYFQTKTNFTYPTKPVMSYAEPADSWFWTFSKKTLFIYNSTELITKVGGQNVISSFGVKLGRGKLGQSSTGRIIPNADYFISIGWDGK